MTLKSNVFTKEGKALVGIGAAGEDLKRGIEATVAAIGGFMKVVSAGDKILLKPNYNTADTPPGSSDPAFVRALIELLYDYGAGEVVVGESSMFALSTTAQLGKTGLLEAARAAGARVEVFREWVEKDTGGQYLRRVGFAKTVLEAPKIVYATCLKTHFQAEFTMSLKIAVAMMRPRERLALHTRHLKEKIADLNLLVTPDLIVTDGRRAFISGGPSHGQVREPGLILASGDRIALDVEGLHVIQSYAGNSLAGRDPWSLTQIRRAVELGLGVKGEADYEVVEAMAPAGVEAA